MHLKNKHLLFIITGIFIVLWQHTSAQHTYIYSDVDKFYRNGLELIEKKLYEAAQQEFENYLAQKPTDEKSIQAQYYLAFCALKLQSPDAEARLENFVRAYPDHPKASEAYLDWGNQYYAKMDYDKAIDYYEKVSSTRISREKEEERKYNLATAYFAQKKYNQSEKLLNELKVGAGKYSSAASYYAGYIAYLEKRYEPALQDLQKASESEDFRKHTPVLITDTYYKQGLYYELVNYSTPLLNRNNDLSQVQEIYRLTADAHYFQKNYQNALSYYKQYVGLLTTQADPELRYRLGFCQFQTRNYQEAGETLKAVAAVSDQLLEQFASYYLGLSYLRLNNKRFAVTALEQAKSLSYDAIIEQEATWLAAKLNFELESYDQSIVYLKEFIEKYPQHPDRRQAIDLLSKAYLNSKKYDEALAYIESLPQRSASLNEAYQQIAFSKGSEFFNQSNYPQAIIYFQKSLSNPQIPDLYQKTKYYLAEAHSLNNNPTAAITYYQDLLSVNRQSAEFNLKSHYGLGYAYYNTEKYDLAIPHFQYYLSQTNRQDPQSFVADALLRLGDCYYGQRDYTQAINWYEQSIRQNLPDRDYALFQKGVILNILDRKDESRASFESIIQQFPGSMYYEDALYQKSLIDLRSGSYAVAISGFSQLIKDKPSSSLIPDALLSRGLAYNNIGNQAAAIEDYKTIIQEYTTHPNASSALFSVQELLSREGRSAEMTPLINKYNAANPNSQTTEKIYFENAQRAYFDQNYPQAISLLNNYLRDYPKSPYIQDARFYLAESYYLSGSPDQGLIFYEMVMRDKKGTFLSRAARRAAGITFDQKKYPLAISYNRYLADVTESKREQILAWINLVKSYYELKRYDSLNFFADKVIQQNDVTGEKNTALLYKGKIAYDNQQWNAALQTFQRLARESSDETGAEAQYLIADIYYKQKLHTQSLETLFELNKKFANYEKWRGRAFLLIADNYLATGETFQAKATLQSIIDKSPDQEVVRIARQKLAAIK
ncbi:MAG: tetratricopeptide repeat protein [Microscillaceae bacterium]|nr:tetratricopeptide repeat protein [Microscillaceae bacterium]